MENVKCVVLGDGAVGKSAMLLCYTTNSFPSEYTPTVFDNYSANVAFENKVVHLSLWDSPGQEDYDKLRPLSYAKTNVFVICFAINSIASLKNISSKWIPEIHHHVGQDIPIIVVGNKSDLRISASGDLICHEQIQEESRKFSQYLYCPIIECSAQTQDNLQQVFDTAILAALDPKWSKKQNHQSSSCECTIL